MAGAGDLTVVTSFAEVSVFGVVDGGITVRRAVSILSSLSTAALIHNGRRNLRVFELFVMGMM